MILPPPACTLLLDRNHGGWQGCTGLRATGTYSTFANSDTDCGVETTIQDQQQAPDVMILPPPAQTTHVVLIAVSSAPLCKLEPEADPGIALIVQDQQQARDVVILPTESPQDHQPTPARTLLSCPGCCVEHMKVLCLSRREEKSWGCAQSPKLAAGAGGLELPPRPACMLLSCQHWRHLIAAAPGQLVDVNG